MRWFKRSITVGGLIALGWALSLSLTFGQSLLFPEAHQDFLGGASYAALFGHDQEALQDALSGSSLGFQSPRISNSYTGERLPRVGPNVRVHNRQRGFPNGLFGKSETAIAADEDGERIVVGYNNADGFLRPPFTTVNPLPGTPGLSGFAFSTDGGATWTDGGVPPVIDNVVTRGDPWLDSDGNAEGTFFYANLAVHLTSGGSLGVSVHRGRFTDETFAWQDVRTFNSANPKDFYDKEAIAAAKDGSGTAFVSVTNFIELCGIAANGFGQIELWRTRDGGDTWQGPVVVNPDISFVNPRELQFCGAEGVLQQASVPAIGPNGEVYVTWQLGPTFTRFGVSTDAAIVVARSLNGGLTFDPPVRVATINSMRQNPPVGFNRIIDNPVD